MAILLFFSILFMIPSCCDNKQTMMETIVLLTGTTSSGKSAVVEAMKKLYGNKYHYFNFDEFESTAIQKKERLLTGDEMALLEDDFFRQIATTSAQEKKSIVDIVLIPPSDPSLPRFTEHPAWKYGFIQHIQHSLKILLYAPLTTIQERMKVRSEKSGEERIFLDVFRQFYGLYKLRESDLEQVIDIVETEPIKKLLRKAADIYLKSLSPESSETKIIESFCNDFIQRFKLDELQKIALVTVYQRYDLIINSAKYSPQEIAQKIGKLAGG